MNSKALFSKAANAIILLILFLSSVRFFNISNFLILHYFKNAKGTSISEFGDEDKATGADTEKEVEESDFVKSIKSRIIIQPVVASLKRNAEFTFDYLMFIILASYVQQ